LKTVQRFYQRLQTYSKLYFDHWWCYVCATGSTLVKCGQTQQKLGQAKRDLMQTTTNSFLQQLKTFLDTDVKSIQVCLHFVSTMW